MQFMHSCVLANILTNRQFFFTSSTDKAAAAINGQNVYAASSLPVKMKEEDEYRKPAVEKLTTLTLI